jgi:hypothetical protein
MLRCRVTDQEITEPWRQLFLVRMRKLQQLSLSNGAFLPFAQQKQSCPCCAAGQEHGMMMAFVAMQGSCTTV